MKTTTTFWLTCTLWITNEETFEVDWDRGSHTHSAVCHTRRTPLFPTHPELGGTEGSSHRLGKDRHGDHGGACKPRVSARFGYRRLQGYQAERLYPPPQGHDCRCEEARCRRQTTSIAEETDGHRRTVAPSGKDQYQRLYQRPAHQRRTRRAVACLEWYRPRQGNGRGKWCPTF